MAEAKYFDIPRNSAALVGRALEWKGKQASLVSDGGLAIPRGVPRIVGSAIEIPEHEHTKLHLIGLTVGILGGEIVQLPYTSGEKAILAEYPISKGDRVIGKIPVAVHEGTGRIILRCSAEHMEMPLAAILETLAHQVDIARDIHADPLDPEVIFLLTGARTPVAV